MEGGLGGRSCEEIEEYDVARLVRMEPKRNYFNNRVRKKEFSFNHYSQKRTKILGVFVYQPVRSDRQISQYIFLTFFTSHFIYHRKTLQSLYRNYPKVTQQPQSN